MKIELTRDNICATLKALGYVPEHACWPGFVECIAPTPGFVTAVMEQLGWGCRDRNAQVIVSSTLQTLMWDARYGRKSDPEEARRWRNETRHALTEAGY